MKRVLLTAAASAAILTAALPAFADQASDKFNSTQFSLRVGAYYPFDNSLSSVDSIWFAAGIDAELEWNLISGARSVISIDWFTRNSGANGQAIPVILNQRWYSGGEGYRTYFQLGAGVSFNDFNQSDTVFAGRAGLGFEWNGNLFFEANFYLTGDDTVGANITGIAGFIGIRF